MSKPAEFKDQIIKELIDSIKSGVPMWRKPWTSQEDRLLMQQRHNGEFYQGRNQVMLWAVGMKKGFKNPYWLTFKQGQELGAHVRKGEQAAFVSYVSKTTIQVENPKTNLIEDEDRLFAKWYAVFNAEQFDGLPVKFQYTPKPLIEETKVRVAELDNFFANTNADIKYGGDRAFYRPSTDHIQMPTFDSFDSAPLFYSTLAHELGHWTSHEKRLNRSFGNDKNAYAKEELVAELSSVFFGAEHGVIQAVRDDHAAYLAHWIEALNEDPNFLFNAASHAGKAYQYIKDLQPKPTPEASLTETTTQTVTIQKPRQMGFSI